MEQTNYRNLALVIEVTTHRRRGAMSPHTGHRQYVPVRELYRIVEITYYSSGPLVWAVPLNKATGQQKMGRNRALFTEAGLRNARTIGADLTDAEIAAAAR